MKDCKEEIIYSGRSPVGKISCKKSEQLKSSLECSFISNRQAIKDFHYFADNINEAKCKAKEHFESEEMKKFLRNR